MADDVEVEGKTSEIATILLEAAEKLGLDPGVVRTSDDGFVVPKDVYKKADWPKGQKPPVRGDAAEDKPQDKQQDKPEG
jgi:hypothetical protein